MHTLNNYWIRISECKILKYFFITGLSISLLVSCNPSADDKTSASDSGDQSSIVPTTSTDTTSEKFSESTLFQLSFVDTSIREIKARINKKSPEVYCNIKIPKKGQLTAVIIPADSTCNIRINQIIMPGDKSDGPFGRDHTFKIDKPGVYRLLIGQNLMAGSTEGCDFTMRLTFK
jgi:hypothetical protein